MKTLEELNLVDDFLVNSLTSHKIYGEQSARYILECILHRQIGKLTVVPQRFFCGENTETHGIRLDVYLDEENGEIFDIEPDQNDGKEEIVSLPRRVRFYHAKIDAGNLTAGDTYGSLRNVIVIFITIYDPFGLNRMVYTIKNRCIEVPELEYEDGAQTIFLYTRGREGNPPEELKQLLHYMEHSSIENAPSENLKKLHRMVTAVKRDGEVGLAYMKSFEREERIRKQGEAEGKAEEIIGKDERYLNVVKPLRKTLYDVVNEEKRVVLLGQAGAGKTTELEKLAQVLCEQNTPPIFIPLNTYSNENIEGLITQWKFDYKIENSVLVLDGYDEIADINSFHRKLDSYVRKHPDQKIVISTRNNFYHLSRGKGQEGSLNQFKEYAIFPILREDISEYLRKSEVDETVFWKQVQMRKLTEQLKVPFFFIHLVEIFKEEGSLPELKDLMPRLIRISMDRDMLKFEQKEELEVKERQIRIILQRIGMTMQLMKTKQLTESELQEIVTEEENKLIRFSGIWKKMPDGSWQFTHNNFKEYVTAEYLVSFPVEKILELVTYEKNRDRIKESWYNVLSFHMES